MAIINIAHLGPGSPWIIITGLDFLHNTLQLILNGIRQLITIAAKELNSVIMERIMGSRNYNTGIGLFLLGKISNRWGWYNSNNNRPSTGRTNTGAKCRLKHLTGNTGITANEDFWHCLRVFPKIQGCGPSQTISQLRRQFNISLSPDTISTKQSSHNQ